MKVLELKETLFQKFMRIKSSMKRILTVLVSALLLTGIGVQASDLIIESKTQTYSEQDSLIKFLGDVKVRYKDITIVGDTADVSVTKDNKLDTATFYEKPYAFQIQNNVWNVFSYAFNC